MKYHYLVGFSSGKSKAGRDWWSINLFGLDRYGKVNVVPVFVNSAEEWDEAQKKAPPQFTAVNVITDSVTGRFVEIKAIDGVAKLNAQ